MWGAAGLGFIPILWMIGPPVMIVLAATLAARMVRLFATVIWKMGQLAWYEGCGKWIVAAWCWLLFQLAILPLTITMRMVQKVIDDVVGFMEAAINKERRSRVVEPPTQELELRKCNSQLLKTAWWRQPRPQDASVEAFMEDETS